MQSKAGRDGRGTKIVEKRKKRTGLSQRNPDGAAARFAGRLVELMSKKEMTADRLATKLDISEDMARKYLRGYSIPPLDDWQKIAGLLGLKDARELLPVLLAE